MEGERMLRIMQGIVSVIICVLLAGAASSQDAKPVTRSENILVSAGAEVMISSKTDLYGNTVLQGARLTFVVARDVIFDGRVVIAEGAPVEAIVTLATPAERRGRYGKLAI